MAQPQPPTTNFLRLLPTITVLAIVCTIVFVRPDYVRNVIGGPTDRGMQQADTLQRAKNLILERFYDLDVTEEELYYAALKGMVSRLDDPYSDYYDPADLADFTKDTEGKFAGLGITVVAGGDGYITIVSPLPNSPALDAGVLPGDKIIAIEGDNVRFMSVNDAVDRLSGDEGESVTLTLRHAVDGLEPLGQHIERDLDGDGDVDVVSVVFVGTQPVALVNWNLAADAIGDGIERDHEDDEDTGAGPDTDNGPGADAGDANADGADENVDTDNSTERDDDDEDIDSVGETDDSTDHVDDEATGAADQPPPAETAATWRTQSLPLDTGELTITPESASGIGLAIAVGDVDGDGDLDLVAALGTRERLSVMLQAEAGVFAPAPPAFDVDQILGREEDVTIVRAIITVPTLVADRLLDEQPGVGYVRINSFGRDTAADLRTALVGLRATGMDKLIIDLRFNRGGLLASARDIADMFLPGGTMITYTAGRHPAHREELRASDAATLADFDDVPIVLLVNATSASASEIVAGALQDHQRAVIVGSTTYGKGVVQNVFDMELDPATDEPRSALKITTARYYTPNGRSIHRDDEHRGGITPDVELRMGDREVTNLLLAHRDEETIGGAGGTPDATNVDDGGQPHTIRHAPTGFVDRHLQIALALLRGEAPLLPANGNGSPR